MKNLEAIANGGGNYSSTMMEDLEDKRMNESAEAEEFVWGQLLNDRNGFLSFGEAIDFIKGCPRTPYGDLIRVNGENYKIIKMFHKPVIDFTK